MGGLFRIIVNLIRLTRNLPMQFCRFGNIPESKFWLWKVAELKIFIEFDLLKVAE